MTNKKLEYLFEINDIEFNFDTLKLNDFIKDDIFFDDLKKDNFYFFINHSFIGFYTIYDNELVSSYLNYSHLDKNCSIYDNSQKYIDDFSLKIFIENRIENFEFFYEEDELKKFKKLINNFYNNIKSLEFFKYRKLFNNSLTSLIDEFYTNLIKKGCLI